MEKFPMVAGLRRPASFKAAFGFPARLPNKGFGRELQRRQGDRWAGDRSIALDHIGTDTFAEMRSAELAQIAGAEYLAELYSVADREALQGHRRTIGPAGLQYQQCGVSAHRDPPEFRCAVREDIPLAYEQRQLCRRTVLVFVHSRGAYGHLGAQVALDPDIEPLDPDRGEPIRGVEYMPPRSMAWLRSNAVTPRPLKRFASMLGRSAALRRTTRCSSLARLSRACNAGNPLIRRRRRIRNCRTTPC